MMLVLVAFSLSFLLGRSWALSSSVVCENVNGFASQDDVENCFRTGVPGPVARLFLKCANDADKSDIYRVLQDYCDDEHFQDQVDDCIDNDEEVPLAAKKLALHHLLGCLLWIPRTTLIGEDTDVGIRKRDINNNEVIDISKIPAVPEPLSENISKTIEDIARDRYDVPNTADETSNADTLTPINADKSSSTSAGGEGITETEKVNSDSDNIITEDEKDQITEKTTEKALNIITITETIPEPVLGIITEASAIPEPVSGGEDITEAEKVDAVTGDITREDEKGVTTEKTKEYDITYETEESEEDEKESTEETADDAESSEGDDVEDVSEDESESSVDVSEDDSGFSEEDDEHDETYEHGSEESDEFDTEETDESHEDYSDYDNDNYRYNKITFKIFVN